MDGHSANCGLFVNGIVTLCKVIMEGQFLKITVLSGRPWPPNTLMKGKTETNSELLIKEE